MDITPVRTYTDPPYPTRDAVDAYPGLLRRLPARWQRNALVLAAVAASGGLLTGCRTTTPSAQAAPPVPFRLAPAFPHGEGRISEGGMGGIPHGKISEAEARQIIIEEAKQAGLTLTDTPVEVKNVPIAPPRQRLPQQPANHVDVVFDASNAEKHITVEFVSGDDVRAWKCIEMVSTVHDIRTKDTALALGAGLNTVAPEGCYAIFYDPLPEADDMPRTRTEVKALGAKLDTQAREELRKQVAEFIAWLKAEKVI